MSLLEVDNINSYYGDSHVLFDVSFSVDEHEVVALLGRNGAGKSTTLKTVAGMIQPRSGAVRLEGQPLERLTTYDIARRGLQLVPEERRVFGGLTTEENLQLAAISAPSAWPLERIWEMFPRLEERRRSRARNLSGGEQQMLAIARALVRDARLILLDEPFEGLAPVIVENLIEVVHELARLGRTLVIVEQNVHAALDLAHRTYVLNNGQVVFEGTPDELRGDPELMKSYLGV